MFFVWADKRSDSFLWSNSTWTFLSPFVWYIHVRDNASHKQALNNHLLTKTVYMLIVYNSLRVLQSTDSSFVNSKRLPNDIGREKRTASFCSLVETGRQRKNISNRYHDIHLEHMLSGCNCGRSSFFSLSLSVFQRGHQEDGKRSIVDEEGENRRK